VLRKTITISFIFIFLCANTEVGQLLKLPNLIQHFSKDHDHIDHYDISFIDFVIIHYNKSANHHKDNHKNDHQNLPFKTINTSIYSVIAFETQTQFSFRKPNMVFVNSTIPFHHDFYTSNVFDNIWLPPKLV
jgi:hypothetical protein